MKRFLNPFAVLLLVVCAQAQVLAQNAASKITAIKCGRLIDVRTGAVTSNAVILIQGERITAVGANLSIPAGAEVIDLSRMTVLPGLIDCHTHLTMDIDKIADSLKLSVPRQTLIGAKNARLTIEAGFTTVRNVGAAGYSDIALRDSINAGEIPGPRIIASGPSLGITGGHCDDNELPPAFHHESEGVADGVAGVMRKTREVIKYGADVIKFCSTGGVLSFGDDPKTSQYTLEEMKTIVSEAHRLGRKVAAHAHGGDGIKLAVLAGVDSIEHGTYIDEEAVKLMKERGTFLVPTLYLADWFLENYERMRVPAPLVAKARVVMPAMKENIARAIKLGVPVALGTDAAVYPHGLNARELAVYVRMGMTPLQAIQAATIHAAKLTGWEDRIGALETGKYADLIAVEGDPLRDVTETERVRVVIRGGVVKKK
ncbi:MAG: amidohydrolase family protein [Blastocatellia bacterium]